MKTVTAELVQVIDNKWKDSRYKSKIIRMVFCDCDTNERYLCNYSIDKKDRIDPVTGLPNLTVGKIYTGMKLLTEKKSGLNTISHSAIDEISGLRHIAPLSSTFEETRIK